MVSGLQISYWGRNPNLLNWSNLLNEKAFSATVHRNFFLCSPCKPEIRRAIACVKDCSSESSNVSHSFTIKGTLCGKTPVRRHISVSFPCQNCTLRRRFSSQGIETMIKGNVGFFHDCAVTVLVSGLLVCYSSSDKAYAESRDADSAYPSPKMSHGKIVHNDYSVYGIPGDGRCLFRSVVHGACVRSGKPAPHETLQKELADELRSNVADEFIKRRDEVEWFIEGDFDTYVSLMRKPHVWGGEPELLMASHVLKMPISVYIYDKDAGGLISIAEYGQEHGKDNPIRVLYHGFGHYDALEIPSKKPGMSKL